VEEEEENPGNEGVVLDVPEPAVLLVVPPETVEPEEEGTALDPLPGAPADPGDDVAPENTLPPVFDVDVSPIVPEDVAGELLTENYVRTLKSSIVMGWQLGAALENGYILIYDGPRNKNGLGQSSQSRYRFQARPWGQRRYGVQFPAVSTCNYIVNEVPQGHVKLLNPYETANIPYSSFIRIFVRASGRNG